MIHLVTFFASIMGGLVFGYNSDVISGAILFIRDQFHLTSVSTESLISGALWAGLLAVLVTGTAAVHLGRKKTYIISAFFVLLGPLLSALEGSLWSLEVGRWILGFGLGINTVIVPLYLSEIAPARHRGKILAAYPCSLTAGGLVSTVVDITFSPHANWQMMLAIGAIPALIQLIGLFFLVESPTWNRDRGRLDQARRDLLRLEPRLTPSELEQRLSLSTLPRAKWRDLFGKKIRISLFIGLCLAALEQATGIDSLDYYAPILLEKAGIRSPETALIITLILAAVGLSMTFLAVALVDRIGRKPLLKVGLLFMAISLAGAGAGFYFDAGSNALRIVVGSSLLLFSASFNLSLGTLIWVLIPEMFSARFRAKGVSLALLVNWIFDALVTQFFLSLVALIGDSGVFFLFAAITIASYAFVEKYVKETSGSEINAGN